MISGSIAAQDGINPKTVAKWRKRATVEDMKTAPSEPRSTVLSEAEEAMIIAFDGTRSCLSGATSAWFIRLRAKIISHLEWILKHRTRASGIPLST